MYSSSWAKKVSRAHFQPLFCCLLSSLRSFSTLKHSSNHIFFKYTLQCCPVDLKSLVMFCSFCTELGQILCREEVGEWVRVSIGSDEPTYRMVINVFEEVVGDLIALSAMLDCSCGVCTCTMSLKQFVFFSHYSLFLLYIALLMFLLPFDSLLVR